MWYKTTCKDRWRQVLNRRKSRAGKSLEHHLSSLFTGNCITFTPQAVTEGNKKPDFIFPSVESYHDASFPVDKLASLAAKTTCKDRWRQVLEEADRIDRKHLITLEGAISENQTDEMISRHLQLVIPKEIHETFSERQQSWLDAATISHILLPRRMRYLHTWQSVCLRSEVLSSRPRASLQQ